MNYSLAATARTQLGRRAHTERAARRVPAVLYGHGIAARPLSVPQSAFVKVFRGAGYSSLIDLAVEGEAALKVVVKDLQLDPLTTEPMHVDFYQVRMDEEMTADVPLKFVGEAAPVKTEGGTLVKSLDKVEVRCLPANLPSAIEVDLSALKTFEDAIAINDLTLPGGVTIIGDTTLTIATVARPLTEDQLKKLEETTPADVSAVKTEGEEKKAAEEAKKAEEEAATKAAEPGGKK